MKVGRMNESSDSHWGSRYQCYWFSNAVSLYICKQEYRCALIERCMCRSGYGSGVSARGAARSRALQTAEADGVGPPRQGKSALLEGLQTGKPSSFISTDCSIHTASWDLERPGGVVKSAVRSLSPHTHHTHTPHTPHTPRTPHATPRKRHTHTETTPPTHTETTHPTHTDQHPHTQTNTNKNKHKQQNTTQHTNTTNTHTTQTHTQNTHTTQTHT